MNNKLTKSLLFVCISIFLLSLILMYSTLYSISMLDVNATDYVSTKEQMSTVVGVLLYSLLFSFIGAVATVHIDNTISQ